MTDDEAELELTEADIAPGEQRTTEPTQFTLKGAFIALTLASVWLAVMGNEKLRGPGAIASLMALCYASGYVLRFIEGRVKHFAARGLSPAWSGLLATAVGSTGAFLYGVFLVQSFTYSFHADNFAGALMTAAFTTLLLAAVAWVVVSLLGVMMVVDLFRRRPRDLPKVLGVHLIDAALGAALFTVYVAVVRAVLHRFDPASVLNWGVTIGGAITGLVFGSSALNAHFEILDIARAKAKAEAESQLSSRA